MVAGRDGFVNKGSHSEGCSETDHAPLRPGREGQNERQHGWEGQPDLGQHHDRSEVDQVVRRSSACVRPQLAMLPQRPVRPHRFRWRQDRGRRRRLLARPSREGLVAPVLTVVMVVAAVVIGRMARARGPLRGHGRLGRDGVTGRRVRVHVLMDHAMVSVDMHMGMTPGPARANRPARQTHDRQERSNERNHEDSRRHLHGWIVPRRPKLRPGGRAGKGGDGHPFGWSTLGGPAWKI